MTFHIGQRVRLSTYGRLSRPRTYKTRTGTVVALWRREKRIQVLVDLHKHPVWYTETRWEPLAPTEDPNVQP